jgi:tetratricopeptide (TPR) repeat protein
LIKTVNFSAGFLEHRSITYAQIERYEEALADLDHALELDPDNASALVNRGTTYAQMKRYDEALADLDRAVEIDPDYVTGFLSRGRVHRQIEEYELALADLERAISLDSEYEHEGWKEIGLALMALQKYENGAEAICRALEAEPACVECWTLLAQAYASFRPPDEVPGALLGLSVAGTDTASVIACRAEAMRRTGYSQQALSELDRAIELDPESAWAIARRGETHRQMECYEEALTDMQHAATLEEGMKNLLANSIGLLFSYLGRYAEAIKWYKQGLGASSEHYTLYNIAVAKARWKGALDAHAEIDAARAALESISDAASRGVALYGLGGLAAVQGDSQSALNCLEEAMKLEKRAVEWAQDDVAWLDLREHRQFQALIQSGGLEQ